MFPPHVTPRRLAASGLAVLILLLGYTGYWFHAADQLRKSLIIWSENQRAAGWQVDYADLTINGFPTRLVAVVTSPNLADPGGLRWRGATLSATLSVFHPHRVALSAPGRHDVAFGAWRQEFTASDLRGDLEFDSHGHVRNSRFHASDVRGGGGSADALVVSLAPLAGGSADHSTPTLAFAITATGIELPAGMGAVLDRRLSLFEIDGRMLGPMPAGPLPRSLRQWSADGGTLAIDRLMLDWAPMAMEAKGTLAFDPSMQPRAAFSTQIRGFAPLMDRLARAGTLSPGAATAGTLMLSLMARPDSQGRAAVPLPVTLQGGRLYLGPAAVAAIPPIAWPN